MGEIAADFPVSAPAISKHLRVLEASGLLQRHIEGRVHHCTLNPQVLEQTATWIESQRRCWNAAFDRLELVLSRTSPPHTPKRKGR